MSHVFNNIEMFKGFSVSIKELSDVVLEEKEKYSSEYVIVEAPPIYLTAKNQLKVDHHDLEFYMNGQIVSLAKSLYAVNSLVGFKKIDDRKVSNIKTYSNYRYALIKFNGKETTITKIGNYIHTPSRKIYNINLAFLKTSRIKRMPDIPVISNDYYYQLDNIYEYNNYITQYF